MRRLSISRARYRLSIRFQQVRPQPFIKTPRADRRAWLGQELKTTQGDTRLIDTSRKQGDYLGVDHVALNRLLALLNLFLHVDLLANQKEA